MVSQGEIYILNPYGSKLFFRLNGQMLLMVKLDGDELS